jgi:hypothetical protein
MLNSAVLKFQFSISDYNRCWVVYSWKKIITATSDTTAVSGYVTCHSSA